MSPLSVSPVTEEKRGNHWLLHTSRQSERVITVRKLTHTCTHVFAYTRVVTANSSLHFMLRWPRRSRVKSKQNFIRRSFPDNRAKYACAVLPRGEILSRQRTVPYLWNVMFEFWKNARLCGNRGAVIDNSRILCNFSDNYSGISTWYLWTGVYRYVNYYPL